MVTLNTFCAADKVSCACYEAKDFFFGESRTPEKPVEIVSSAHNDQKELNKKNKSVAPDVWNTSWFQPWSENFVS